MAANALMKILKNILILIATVLLSYFLASSFYSIYNQFYPAESGGYFAIYEKASEYFIGFGFSYLFFLFLLFTSFPPSGQAGKWRYLLWPGIAAIPALAFLLYFDFSHIYFHILFPLAGWLIGWGIGKLRMK